MTAHRFIACLILTASVPLTAAAATTQRYQKDLNGDGQAETIIVEDIYDESNSPELFLREAIETSVRVMKADGSVSAEVRVPNERPRVSFIDLRHDRSRQIVIWTMGGAHYTNLAIFDYRDGVLDPLFINGSACEVVGDFEVTPPTIRVGRANWSDPNWNYASGVPLWNVYAWNSRTFVFDDKKSTTRETVEEEEVMQYVDKVAKSVSH